MKSTPEQVEEVFNFWITTVRNSGRGLQPVLTDKRKKVVTQAIDWYGVDGCKKAIIGCSKSDFHMGKNKQNKKYDSIELILRDAEHIERFADIADEMSAEEQFLAEA
jgi:hypothetical protein